MRGLTTYCTHCRISFAIPGPGRVTCLHCDSSWDVKPHKASLRNLIVCYCKECDCSWSEHMKDGTTECPTCHHVWDLKPEGYIVV